MPDIHLYGNRLASPVAGGAGSVEYRVQDIRRQAAGLGVPLAGVQVYTVFAEVERMTTRKPKQVWSVADAQANLPEVLRLAESEGPQYIGTGKTFVVSPVEATPDQDEPELTLGQWLVENAPRGTNLVVPDDELPEDEIPWTEEVNQ